VPSFSVPGSVYSVSRTYPVHHGRTASCVNLKPVTSSRAPPFQAPDGVHNRSTGEQHTSTIAGSHDSSGSLTKSPHGTGQSDHAARPSLRLQIVHTQGMYASKDVQWRELCNSPSLLT
jgi:hypothetical protein